jgi:purine-binding chemotaxis protein CheW
MRESNPMPPISENGDTSTTSCKDREILLARARKLAQEIADSDTQQTAIPTIEFLLENEHYAVEAAYVREVQPLKQLTPLPCTPPFVLGIINMRGQIVSVVDLKIFFSLPQKGFNDLTKVIVLHSPDMEFGILVEEVIGPRLIQLENLKPPLSTLGRIQRESIKGITSEQVIILDAPALLKNKKMRINQ